MSIRHRKAKYVFILGLSILMSAFFNTDLVFSTEANGATKMERQEFISKGGLGLIDGKLFIATKSPNNELLLSNGRRWKGLGRDVLQVVLAWHNNVVDMKAVPKAFQLSECTIVSFHPDHVDFIDLNSGSSGYYRRMIEDDDEKMYPYDDLPKK